MTNSTLSSERACSSQIIGTRRRIVPAILAVGVVSILGACSTTATAPSGNATPPGSTTGSITGTTTVANPTADERLADAKSVAVAFFEAQAVNNFDEAAARSSGAAATTVRWARGVNTLAAANGTPYQVPTTVPPNVRVQIDSLTPEADDRWVATGFVELSFRPGPVAETTTQPPAPGATSVPRSPSTFVTDVVYSTDGGHLRLDDYRLDDTPYPVSQLFLEIGTQSRADAITGKLTLGHRDLDGSVQYLTEYTPVDEKRSSVVQAATFIRPSADSKPPLATPGQVLADAGPLGRALVVFPGYFPGSAGTLRLSFGPEPKVDLDFAAPDFPVLTTHPVNVIARAQAASTTTSTASTSTTTPSGVTTTLTATTSAVTPSKVPTVSVTTTSAASPARSTTSATVSVTTSSTRPISSTSSSATSSTATVPSQP